MVCTKEEKLRIVKRYLKGIIDYPPGATSTQKDNIWKKDLEIAMFPMTQKTCSFTSFD